MNPDLWGQWRSGSHGFLKCLGAVLPPLLLSGLVPSFIKGSFTHLSTPVRILFQLSEILIASITNSETCKNRQLIITTIVMTVIRANIFEQLIDTVLVVLHESSPLIFLTTPRGRYYCYSHFPMRRLGTERAASVVR